MAKTAVEEKQYSVYGITRRVDERLTGDDELREVIVIGEITQITRHSSGHIYLTLADKEHPPGVPAKQKATLRCTFFRFANQYLKFKPQKGNEVAVRGSISVYYPAGNYSFNIRSMRDLGEGNLYQKIQELRRRLFNEGLFDPARKKPLPLLPKRIGIVTGENTAALRDIQKQIADRYPHVEVILSPALMQGEAAPAGIVRALKRIDQPEHGCELIILARGGGSVEDLMAFNDESVVYAVAECRLPVVTGIGHQVDHPVVDDAADVAAATPTDAAKTALPDLRELYDDLSHSEELLNLRIQNLISYYSEKLNLIGQKPFFKDPYVLIEEHYMRLDDFERRMYDSLGEKILREKELLNSFSEINLLFERKFNRDQTLLERLNERLLAYSPLGTLKRGYTLSYRNGELKKKAAAFKKSDKINVRFHDGSVTAAVESVDLKD